MSDLTTAQIMELRKLAQSLDPILQIGKGGLSEGAVSEVKRQLKDAKLIKVKLLKSAREQEDRKDLAAELAEKAGAFLVEVRGNTVVLYRTKAQRRERPPRPAGAAPRARPRPPPEPEAPARPNRRERRAADQD